MDKETIAFIVLLIAGALVLGVWVYVVLEGLYETFQEYEFHRKMKALDKEEEQWRRREEVGRRGGSHLRA